MRKMMPLCALIMASIAAGCLADPELHYIGLAKGLDIKFSNDAGLTFEDVTAAELVVQRCDIQQEDIYAYCVSLFKGMKQDGCWGVDILDTYSLSPNGGRIGKLLDTYAPTIRSVGTNDEAMVLQAVIWELLYEQDSTFDLEAGNFQIRQKDGSPLTAAQLALSAQYLATPGTSGAIYYKSLTDANGQRLSQDLATASVPEPVMLSLLGLGAAGLLRRKPRR